MLCGKVSVKKEANFHCFEGVIIKLHYHVALFYKFIRNDDQIMILNLKNFKKNTIKVAILSKRKVH